MAAPTPESLLALLKKSKLLDAEQLAFAEQAAKEADDARSLAKTLVRKRLLTLWQANQLLRGKRVFHVGKYKLIESLGSGGMGRVYLAEHTTMGRNVALKIIPRQFGRDPASFQQFLTEARAIAALDHPNIVHAYNVDNEGDHYYIAMEFVEGKDLKRKVEAEGPLECDRAAGYIRQAAEGLAHAHGRDMIHCDVKPANLLVNDQDVVKILDMGMARLIGPKKSEGSEKDERLLGTVDYLAPEQALESPELDHRVDVYSLGCTFYFLLTGRPPFPEGTLHERIVKHQTQKPQEIAELRGDVPEELVEVCRKMMAKDPDDRYQSAEEVSRALADCHIAEVILEPDEPEDQAGTPVVATGAGAAAVAPSPRAKNSGSGAWASLQEAFYRRPRTFLGLGIGGLAAVGLLVAAVFLFGGSGDKPDSELAQGVAAVEDRDAADAASSTASEPAPNETVDDDEWPDFPQTGNLTDFDPTALAAEIGDVPANSTQPKKPDEPPTAEKPEADSPPANDPAPQPEPEPSPAKEPTPQPEPEPAPTKESTAEPADPEQPKPAAEMSEPEKPEPEKPAEEEGKATAEKPAEEPSEKKEEPKKPDPPDPLRGLADAVDIPELATGRGAELVQAFTIGTIQTAPDVPWQLYLLGKTTAVKKNREFLFDQQEPDPAKASWTVRLQASSSAGGDPVVEDVARIWREGAALQFQWADDASSSANYLRNCILQVRVEGDSRYVALSQPKQVEPIPIDLDRGVVNASVPVKWLPDAGNLRVEITEVEGRKGHVVDPAEPAEPKSPLEVAFPRTDRHGNTRDRVAFRLTFSVKPVAMGVKLQLREPQTAFFRAFKGQNLVIARNQNEQMQEEVRAKLNPQDQNKAPRGAERQTLDRQLDELERWIWYIDFYDEVHEKARIHFRVFNDVEGRELVLAST